MAISLESDLKRALDHLVTASSQDSTKGKLVADWIATKFKESGRSSIVSEKKQVYNRVVEQFKHRSSHVVFVYHDNDTLQKLKQQIAKRAYPELNTVLLIRLEASDFNPTHLFYRGDSAPKDYYKKQFPHLQQEELGDVASGVETAGIPGAELSVDWQRADLAREDPCELIALGQSFRQAFSALKAGKHVVLVGPPGTGKTQLAVCICKSLGVGHDLVTATSDWTTFDTIGGYFPDPSLAVATGTGALDFFPGVVLRSIERAKWLVIDEINRADIDKAFGELFTMLSGESIRLPFKRRKENKLLDIVLGEPDKDEEDVIVVPVPETWRVLGTMNTFDKASLFQLSYAFMRRFAFVQVPIPMSADYEQLLIVKAEVLRAGDAGEVFYTKCLEYLRAIFTPSEDEGLGREGLLVGPAIPLDIIAYLSERRDAAGGTLTSSAIKMFMLEAIEMYLYPQFEGQDRKHERILEAITGALDLDEVARASTGKSLAIWTGYEVGDSRE